ncbi:MAG: hypothetical protein ACOYON_03555 [Fimbriimonas sp.]
MTLCGTGDGYYAVRLCESPEDFEGMHELALNIATGDGITETGTRVALHYGSAEKVKVLGNRSELAGHGMNFASRIIGFGVAGQIIMSEEFLREWKNQDGALIIHDIYPSLEDEGFPVRVKHGVRGKIWRIGRGTSLRLKRLTAVDELIYDELSSLDNELSELIAEVEPDAQLKARYTIWELKKSRPGGRDEPMKRILRPSLRWSAHPEVSPRFDSSLFRLAPPEGPGLAYTDFAPRWLADLPDAEADLDAYRQAICDRWKIMPETIRGWSRWPRAIIDLPLSITAGNGSADGHQPDAVLSIDLLPPLSTIDDEVWRNIADYLTSDRCYALSLLVLLRGTL